MRWHPHPWMIAAALCASLTAPAGDAPNVGGFGQGGQPFSRAPYLQFAATNLMHVVWRTPGPIQAGVRFGRSLDALNVSVPSTSIVVRASLGTAGQTMLERWKTLRTPENLELPKLHSAPVGTFQYEARLGGLEPATKYFYAVYDGEQRLTPSDTSYSFVTPPVAGTRPKIRFASIGDSGTGRLPQHEVFKAMLTYVRESGAPLDFWIHVGDMAYGVGRDMEFQTRVFEPYELLMRNTVCWPTMGNHEGANSKGTTGVGPYFDAYVMPTRGEAGGVASGTEAYYSFDFANIHFICLDSHDLDRTPAGAMAKWLKTDLEKAKADWLIAFWHHPPYTKGSHDSDKEKDLTEMRQHIMPIVESGGVDLVLTGHSHSYERSMLMDGAYATPTVGENVILDDGDGDPQGDGPYRKSAGIQPHQGTVQIVAGNGGQSMGRNGSLPVMKRVLIEHGSVVVEVDGDTLKATMINRLGAVRDVVSIVKRGTVEPVRLALPWRLPDYKKPDVEPKVPSTPAVKHQVVVAKGEEWRYLDAEDPRGLDWTKPGFAAEAWRTGRGMFGRGIGSFGTQVKPGTGRPPAVYLRREFAIPQADAVTEVGLLVDYSDGFIAYLNGREVARVNIERSNGRNVQGLKNRSERGTDYVVLKDAHKYLRDGANLLTIETHAATEAPDFWFDASVVIEN